MPGCQRACFRILNSNAGTNNTLAGDECSADGRTRATRDKSSYRPRAEDRPARRTVSSGYSVCRCVCMQGHEEIFLIPMALICL